MAEPTEPIEPTKPTEPTEPTEPVDDKFEVQVINLLQELCDLIKATQVSNEDHNEDEDLDKFDDLLDQGFTENEQ